MKHDRIRELKDAAQSIIDNAESIVGGEKYRTTLDVTIHICPNEIITVTVQKEFIPEKIVEFIDKGGGSDE